MAGEGPASGKRPESDFNYLDIGGRMLGAVAAGLFGGWLAKRWIHADWPLAVGGMVGIAIGMYEMILFALKTNEPKDRR
jgi:hypothetical protein